MKIYFVRFLISVAIVLAFAGTLEARTSRRSSSSSSMSGGQVVMLLGGIVLVGGLIIALSIYQDRRRSQAIQALATRLGFTYRWKPTDADNTLIDGCGIGTVGRGHTTSHILESTPSDDLRMTLFDYAYTVGTGKSSQTYKQTVTRMQSPLLNLPVFSLYPETFFSKVGKLFGGADINFPESPDFSKRYILRGPNEAAIRSLFTPALLQFLARPDLSPPTIDGAGDKLFVHRSRWLAKPQQLEGYIAEGKQLLTAFFEAQHSRPAAAPPPLPV